MNFAEAKEEAIEKSLRDKWNPYFVNLYYEGGLEEGYLVEPHRGLRNRGHATIGLWTASPVQEPAPGFPWKATEEKT